MRSLISHLRLTIRLLLKSPGFTITAIVILGLGIGSNTAIFSLINGVLLKPLPYPEEDRLVRIYQPTQDVPRMNMAYSDYVDFKASQHTLHSGSAVQGRQLSPQRPYVRLHRATQRRGHNGASADGL